jgi:shikimate kinase
VGDGHDLVIVLVGLMGTGKSSVGRLLAARRGVPFVDSDDRLAETDGRTAAEIRAGDGEDRLHALEAQQVVQLDAGRRQVVAAAASVVEDEAARSRLAELRTVYLRADPAVLAERVGRSGHRPLPEDPDAFAAYLRAQDARRRPLYESVATLVVDVDTHTIDQVVEAIDSTLP